MSKTKDELLDQLTELYKASEDQINSKEHSEQERFFAAVLCNAYAMAFARIHSTFHPTIPEGAGNTILIRSNISLFWMQAISMPVSLLEKILLVAAANGLETDIVHLVQENELLTAYLIEPHLENKARQLHCSKSIFNTEQ